MEEKEHFCRECGYKIPYFTYHKNFLEFLMMKPTGKGLEGVKHEDGRFAHYECIVKSKKNLSHDKNDNL